MESSKKGILIFALIPWLFLFTCSNKGPTSLKDTSSNTITDIDGNIYKTVKIGNQWWMAENLKVTHYCNGDFIPNIIDSMEWGNLSSGGSCCYDNDENNISTHGLLYNWFAVKDNRNISPAGWHVPSDAEWKQLEMYLGMSKTDADTTSWRGTTEGGKLKALGTLESKDGLWHNPNKGATNEVGFSALPSGSRYYSIANSKFVHLNIYASFWTSSEVENNGSWCRYLSYSDSKISRIAYQKERGYSVRCIKD